MHNRSREPGGGRKRAVDAERARLEAAAARKRADEVAADRRAPAPDAVEFAALMRKHGVTPGRYIKQVGGVDTPVRAWLVRAFVRGGVSRAGYDISSPDGFAYSFGSDAPGTVVTTEGQVWGYVVKAPDRLLIAEPATADRARLVEIASSVVAGGGYPVTDGQERDEKAPRGAPDLDSLRTGADWAAFFSTYPSPEQTGEMLWRDRSLRRLKKEFSDGYWLGGGTLIARSGRVARIRPKEWRDLVLDQLWEPAEVLPAEVTANVIQEARYVLGIDPRPRMEETP